MKVVDGPKDRLVNCVSKYDTQFLARSLRPFFANSRGPCRLQLLYPFSPSISFASFNFSSVRFFLICRAVHTSSHSLHRLLISSFINIAHPSDCPRPLPPLTGHPTESFTLFFPANMLPSAAGTCCVTLYKVPLATAPVFPAIILPFAPFLQPPDPGLPCVVLPRSSSLRPAPIIPALSRYVPLFFSSTSPYPPATPSLPPYSYQDIPSFRPLSSVGRCHEGPCPLSSKGKG